MFMENCNLLQLMCTFRLRSKLVVQVVNHAGLTPSDSLKLIVCFCSLPVCVCVCVGVGGWPLCLWQGPLKCHRSKSHDTYYSLHAYCISARMTGLHD